MATYLVNGTLTISMQTTVKAKSEAAARHAAFRKMLVGLDEFLNENTEASDMHLTIDEAKEHSK